MKIYDSVMFGQALKLRRKEIKYTQRDISELTGFSISFISDLENGKSTAEIGKAIYIANVLGLDIEIMSRGSRSVFIYYLTCLEQQMVNYAC